MKLVTKLRAKVISTSVLSIFVILIIVMGSINFYNFYKVEENADLILDELERNKGRFPEIKDGREKNPKIDDKSKMYVVDYFTFAFDDPANPSKIAFDMPQMSEGKAMEIAINLLDKGDGWTERRYRYRNFTCDSKRYVSVIDQKRELEPSYRVLTTSMIGVGIGVVFSFLVLIPISKLIAVPFETALKKQKRFISDASHQLKTPLAIISLNNDLEASEKGESENTENISKQIKVLNEVATNLNTLAKIDEEEKVSFTQLDISKIARDFSSTFEATFRSKNIAFSSSIEDGLRLEGNPEMMKKLLTIILDNASKYSYSQASLTIKRDQKTKRIIIEERNDDPTIPEGDLSPIFERFFRLQKHRSSSVTGSGIGLSIAKEIVDRHKGEIKAKGKNGEFILTVTI